MLTKYAATEILSVERADQTTLKTMRLAHRADFSHVERRPGYLYVRSRAISSRINDNFDGFPAEEIKAAYGTFMGRPCFVNHKNSNHRRARGVIVEVALHEDTNPDGSPDTWAEVLMEVDAVRFPVLAREIEKGNIARTSMGTDVKYSVCTACGNKAYTPVDYCAHIPKMKGMKIRRTLASGEKQDVLVAEICYGLNFFENSLLVEPPADPTAYVLGVESGDMAKAASRLAESVGCIACANPGMKFTAETAPMCNSHTFQAQQGYDWGSHNFPANISTRSSKVALDDLMRCTNCDGPLKGDYDNVECTKCGWNYDPKSLFADIAHSGGPYADKVLRIDQNGLVHAVPYSAPRSAVQALLSEALAYEPAGQGYCTALKRGQQCDCNDYVPDPGPSSDWWDNCGNCGHSKQSHVGGTEVVGSKTSALKPVIIKANEIREGDRLDISGKTRVEKRHPRTDKVLVRTQTRGARSPSVAQWDPDENVRVYREGSMAYDVIDNLGEPYIRDGKTGRIIGEFNLKDVLAYGETKAPAKVDTLRAEACPVCGDDEAFNGEQCNVCGYTQPPEQFRDPDLDKAKEMDLRQDQQDGQEPLAPEVPAEAPQAEDLQCTNCGEVFSAEGDPATDPDSEPEAEPGAQTTPPEADPEHPDDAKDGDPAKADKPHSVNDLADLSDAELGLADDDEEDPKDDVDEDPSPEAAPDAKGEGRVVPETAEDADANRADADPEIGPNMTCPVCGMGTLIPMTAPEDQTDVDEAVDPSTVPPKKVPKNSSRQRA